MPGAEADPPTGGSAPGSGMDLATVGVSASSEELRKIRERVLNVVGHELLTPASTIRGLADTLVRAAPDQRDELLAALQRSSRRLESLVNDLLLAAGVTTVLPTARPADVPVLAAVRASWGDADGLVLEGDDGITAHIDEVSLRRVLDHILGNARAYGATPVTVSARQVDRDVELVVDSPGAPLHPEELRLATEPFYRGEHAVMTAPGLGLGLAVARALIEHAGGSLSLSDRPGGGLVTRLVLSATGRARR